jgi:hypothetical protein
MDVGGAHEDGDLKPPALEIFGIRDFFDHYDLSIGRTDDEICPYRPFADGHSKERDQEQQGRQRDKEDQDTQPEFMRADKVKRSQIDQRKNQGTD